MIFRQQVTSGWSRVWVCCTSAKAYSTGWYQPTKASGAAGRLRARRPPNTPESSGFGFGGAARGWRSSSTTDYQRFTAGWPSSRAATAISFGRLCWRKRTPSEFSPRHYARRARKKLRPRRGAFAERDRLS